ncbi:chromatin assembly factor 1 subunit A [Armigeres subalbatus]|uniref:chromatin assembly factor 1 subunit A n=1 Tax=Armigeres subalbatus TaxID=124917 RepID=UPI002ED4B3DE
MASLAKGDKLSPSSAAKKLKQSRLPFQILSGSPVAFSEPTKTTPSRKRKPSIEADVNRATKIGRTSEAKENVKDPVEAVVVLDEESIEAPTESVAPTVEIQEESLSQTPTKKADESNDASGSAKKDDRIMIKFPVGKKKARKSNAGEGSAKKKGQKEKKKQRKLDKKTKGNESVEPAEESIMIDDDSDLSDAEKEDEKGVVKVTDTPEDNKQDQDEEDKIEQNNVESAAVISSQDDAVEDQEESMKVVASVETSEDKSAVPNTTKDKSDEDKSGADTEIENKSDKLTEVEKVDEKSDTAVKSDEQINELKQKVEDEAVTPRRMRLPRAATQKTNESELQKAEGTPKRSKSTKKSPADEKSASKTQKRQSSAEVDSPQVKDKPNTENKKENEKTKKSSAGALDKLFAKIQTENKKKPNDSTEILKTPEKNPSKADDELMEVDQQEEAGAKNPNTSAISVTICLDESNDGAADGDDEENAYMLCTPNSKERSLLSDSKQEKKLTPKQLARRKEAEQRHAAKLQEMEEKKKKKLEEKETKQREKEEQELLKKKEKEEKEEQKRKEREEKEEQKRKEKEEKEEQKRKEKEEKERKRLAEVEAKTEEKRKKEEQKEEERKKKEEEKEAEVKRKQKTAQAFQSFFVKKPVQKDLKQSDDENSMDRQSVGDGIDVVPRLAFMPFCVKGDMRLAPVCRVFLGMERKKRLEEMLLEPDAGKNERNGLYLQQLKNKNYVVGKCERTKTAPDDEGEDDDVMIVDDNVCHQIEVDPAASPSRRYRAKYFLFEENRRPPYRGTWRKQSTQIKPRRPFVQDTKFFDYEVDSDDEWEEEEPGESLHGSDDEKDVDPVEEDYEVDNDFFVPHGHLSDEEMQAEDDVIEDNSPETQKAKLKIMQQEFAAEMKKKTEKIKPRLIGCLWENGPGEEPECSAVIREILKARAMLFDPEEPISFTVQKNEPESNSSSPSKEKEQTERKLKQIKLVDEGVKELITLIHGSALNRKFLIKEFLAYWAKRRDEGEINAPQFAHDSIRTKILQVASWRPCPDEGPMQNKMCWYVNKEALVKYGLIDLKIPTGWEFILKPIIKSKKEKKPRKEDAVKDAEDDGDKKSETKKESPKDKQKNDGPQSTPSSASKSKTPAAPASNITKFTKKLSEDDKRKQFAAKGRKSATASPNNGSRKSAAVSSPVVASPSSDAKPATKKRVQLLMSVPRGQSINQTTKSNLISQFLAKGGTTTSSDKGSAKVPESMEVDPPVANGNHGGQATEPGEVIVLDD